MAACVFGWLLKPLRGILAAPEGPWAPPGAPCGPLGGSFGLLEGFWAPLGGSCSLWAVLGASWRLLGSSWGPLQALWAGPWALHKTSRNQMFYMFLGLRGLSWRRLGRPWSSLGRPWEAFGLFEPSWAGLGVSWTVLGGLVEGPRAVGNRPASRKPLQAKSKSRLSRHLLISTFLFCLLTI